MNSTGDPGAASTCRECHGTLRRGMFGPVGFGFLSRACETCGAGAPASRIRVTASTLAGRSATVELSSAATIGDLRAAVALSLDIKKSQPLRFTLGTSALPRDDTLTIAAVGVTDGAHLTAMIGGLVVGCKVVPGREAFDVEVCIGTTVTEFRQAVVDAQPHLSDITDLSLFFPSDIRGRQLRDTDFAESVAVNVFQRDCVTIDLARNGDIIDSRGIRRRPTGDEDFEDYDRHTERSALQHALRSTVRQSTQQSEEIAAAMRARDCARDEQEQDCLCKMP